MMWKYREPSPEDYDSFKEYQDAMDAYDAAESLYEEKCIERYYGENRFKHFIQWMKSDY